MSTGQKYSGGGSHANPSEQTAQNATQAVNSVTQTAVSGELTPEDLTRFGQGIVKNPKPGLTFKVDILNNGRYGNSHAMVLLWALRNHQDLLQKEGLDSLKHEEFENAHNWFGELSCCNEMFFDVAAGLAELADKNYWATHNTNHDAYTKDVVDTARRKKGSYEQWLSKVAGLTPEEAESVEDYNRVQARKSLLKQTAESGWNEEEIREKLEHLPLAMLRDLLLACKTSGSSSDQERDMILDEIHKRIADL